MRIILHCTFFLLPILGFADDIVKNVYFKYTGAHVIITYDLYPTSTVSSYNISIEAYSKNHYEKLNATMFTGDVGEFVKAGVGKTAYWQTKGDNINFTGDMYIKVIAKPRIDVSMQKHLLKSALLPGLGEYRLNNNNYHISKGLAAYGSVATSILFNKSALNNYNNYLSSSNSVDANNFFSTAVNQRTFSYVFAGTAIAIWGYSLVKTYYGVKKLNKPGNISSLTSQYYTNKSNSTFVGNSPVTYVEIKGIFMPPSLNVNAKDIKLYDVNNADINILKAAETAMIKFDIRNDGMGDAYNINIFIQEENKLRGIDMLKRLDIGTIRKGQSRSIAIPITTNLDLESGTAKVSILVKEENGFGLDPIEVNITTQKFLAPNLELVDYKFSTEKGGTAKKGEKIILQANLQNIGFGDAASVNVKFKYPQGVFAVSEVNYMYNVLSSNQHTTLQFEFITNNEYKDTIVPITIEVNESRKRYGTSQTFGVRLNQNLSKLVTNIYGDASFNTYIKPALLNSDVNINIPFNNLKFPNKYAIIIGNEDYSSRQPNLTKESNVDYAQDDAKIIKEYLIRTLGFDEKNIFLTLNATSGEMKQVIARLYEILQILPAPEKAEVIFYYAGHGYPDEVTKIPYLMPVDVTVNNLESAIKLSDLTTKLGQTKAGKITLFLDACFTGEGRNQGLLAARTARIKPEPFVAKGNMVIFSASGAEQTALPNREQQHGMFTYFLLKNLQLSKGNVSYGELYNYLKQNVAIESTRTVKRQDPEIIAADGVKEKWQFWKLVGE